VTPRHDKFVQSILGSKCHVITTCRAKQAYSMDEKTRKVEKLGMEPQQRDGLDFEMTLVFHMNQQHIATATKDRTKLFDGRDCSITKDTAEKIKAWLADGVPAVEAPIDYKAKCRELYAKLGADVAGPIVKANGEDWKKSYGEMLAAGGQTNG
jgi:hypothetical protein